MNSKFIDFKLRIERTVYFTNLNSTSTIAYNPSRQKDRICELEKEISLNLTKEDILLYYIETDEREVKVIVRLTDKMNTNLVNTFFQYGRFNDNDINAEIILNQNTDNVNSFEELLEIEKNKILNEILKKNCEA